VLKQTSIDSKSHITTITSSSFGSSLDRVGLEMKIYKKTSVCLVFI